MPYEIGQKFGKLTIVGFESEKTEKRNINYAICRCECGGLARVEKYNLKGNSTQCSDCAISARAARRMRHKHSISYKDKDPIGYKCYYTWQAMKRRCTNKKDNAYHRYGGRGIGVSNEWLASYENFLNDMGLPPTKDHQIDRIDNDDGYCKENCHWVTRTSNARNKGNNRVIAAFGKALTLSAWEVETGIKRETIAARLNKGLSPESALSDSLVPAGMGNIKKISTPSGVFASMSDCSRAIGVSISTIHGRLKSDSFPDWAYTD